MLGLIDKMWKGKWKRDVYQLRLLPSPFCCNISEDTEGATEGDLTKIALRNYSLVTRHI